MLQSSKVASLNRDLADVYQALQDDWYNSVTLSEAVGTPKGAEHPGMRLA